MTISQISYVSISLKIRQDIFKGNEVTDFSGGLTVSQDETCGSWNSYLTPALALRPCSSDI